MTEAVSSNTITSDTMRAWVADRTGEPSEVLRLEERPVPEPGPGFLRLRVAAAAMAFPDVLMCRGSYPLTPAHPFTPGQEVVGTVTAVGDGVDPGLVGSRRMGVTAFYMGAGGFAEEALARVDTTHPAPEWLADADAATFHIAFQTGWIGLKDRAAVCEGERLVVLGAAGGTGAAAVQLGRVLGARVVAVAGGDEKTAYCRDLGADVVIDHRTVDDLAAAVTEATDGHGADVVYDPVGGAVGEAAAGAMANEGRFLLVGFAAGEWPRIDPAQLVYRNFAVLGVYAGAYDRAHAESSYEAMFPLLRGGELRSVVTRTVALEALPAALDALAARSVTGRWVVADEA